MESTHEGIELSENLCFREIECLAFRHISDLFFRVGVALLVFTVELNAGAKDIDEFSWVLFPNKFVETRVDNLVLLIENAILAVLDHLIRDLNEETSHLVSCVVESCNCVDHLNRIHKSRKSINDLLGSAMVQWVNELFESSQILHIVLCFVQLVSQEQVQTVVLHHKLRNRFVATRSLSIVLFVTLQAQLNNLEILGFQLFRPVCDFLHSSSPIDEFSIRS